MNLVFFSVALQNLGVGLCVVQNKQAFVLLVCRHFLFLRLYLFACSLILLEKNGSKYLYTLLKTHRHCTDAHAHHFGSSSRAGIFCSSHSWREILNNKYPSNNECAAGCSCLGGIISNFLPMFHIPTPACRHSPSLHPKCRFLSLLFIFQINI